MAESIAKPQTEPSQNLRPNACPGGMPYSSRDRFSILDKIHVARATKNAMTALSGNSLCTVKTPFPLFARWNPYTRIIGTANAIPTQMSNRVRSMRPQAVGCWEQASFSRFDTASGSCSCDNYSRSLSWDSSGKNCLLSEGPSVTVDTAER